MQEFRNWVARPLVSCALFCTLSLGVVFPSAAALKSQFEVLRKRNTPCGFYLVNKNETTTGERLSKGLGSKELIAELDRRKNGKAEKLEKASIGELRELAGRRLKGDADQYQDMNRKKLIALLQDSFKVDPEHQMLMGVGPMGFLEKGKLARKTKSDIQEAGHPELKVRAIRQVRAAFESRRGIWTIDSDGSYVRIEGSKDLDATQMKEIAKTLDPEKPYFFVGAPVMSEERKSIMEGMGEGFDSSKHKFKSHFWADVKEWFKTLTSSPKAALTQLLDEIVYFFPRLDDFQKPSFGESRNFYMKVIAPGIIVFSVLTAFSGNPMHILVPVTLANATSSTFTAFYSSFFKNWWGRSVHTFPTTLIKSVFTSAFFVVPVALGKVAMDSGWTPQWGDMGSILTLSGLVALAHAKWMSVAFNVAWRFPMHKAAYVAEEEHVEQTLKEGIDAPATHHSKWRAFLDKHAPWMTKPLRVQEEKQKDLVKNHGKREQQRYATENAKFNRTLIERYTSWAATPAFVASAILGGYNWGHSVMFIIGALSTLALFSKNFRAATWHFFNYLGATEQVAVKGLKGLVAKVSGIFSPFSKLFSNRRQRGLKKRISSLEQQEAHWTQLLAQSQKEGDLKQAQIAQEELEYLETLKEHAKRDLQEYQDVDENEEAEDAA